jgi:ketosteroid isomerase-like protein
LACLPKISSGSFRARTGRWLWPLAGTHRGLEELLRKAAEAMETSFTAPPEFVAQRNRVVVIGVATGKVRATNKPFKDNWVFAFTVREGKVATIREYVDTQALARAAEIDARSRPRHRH